MIQLIPLTEDLVLRPHIQAQVCADNREKRASIVLHSIYDHILYAQIQDSKLML